MNTIVVLVKEQQLRVVRDGEGQEEVADILPFTLSPLKPGGFQELVGAEESALFE